ncbi:MAG TPA: peptidylprolyl isomerase [Thermoanaerobaculia bacterium]
MKSILYGALLFALVACNATDPANTTAGTEAEGTTATATDTSASTTAAATDTNSTAPAAPAQQEKPMSEYQDQVAVIKTTAGEIQIRFFPDVAPNHVKNFIDLANQGFYNGTKFHRVIPGFMIQGGDPNTKSGDPYTWGTGGSPNRLRAEFNNVKHKRGIVSMARSTDPNSASSQFFIMVADYPSLDNQYSVFGQVLSGMEVVDKIVSAKTERERPVEPTAIESITFRAATDAEKGPAPQA